MTSNPGKSEVGLVFLCLLLTQRLRRDYDFWSGILFGPLRFGQADLRPGLVFTGAQVVQVARREEVETGKYLSSIVCAKNFLLHYLIR